MTRAACTIVSLNYLPYARVLCESFLNFHPDCKFYVLLVDRLPKDFDVSGEQFELVLAEDLGIPDFASVAFKFDILELNTNVKPTFLKSLIDQGIHQLIYFDPDICVYNDVGFIFNLLKTYPIVLTPHCTSPTPESDRNLEQAFLLLGIFNLGFLAISADAEAVKFLSWWEQRCLASGFDEKATGLFVDQKWANLIPCLFSNVHILKHCGCNVAYWNVFERQLSSSATGYLVNGAQPLVFFHFSGIDLRDSEKVSTRGSSRSTLDERPDLKTLFKLYKQSLSASRLPDSVQAKYAFGAFSNGMPIPRLARRLYASSLQNRSFIADPFNSDGEFYKFAKKAHLLGHFGLGKDNDTKSSHKSDFRLKVLHRMFKSFLRVLGAERYTALLGYFSYLSVLRHQITLFEAELGPVEGHSRLKDKGE
jgi:hypothetical protein